MTEKSTASATTDKALRIRERVKKSKPNFVRQESWRYKRLKENWRRPRGLDNKMRRKIKGWPPTVNVGYRGPKIARGLHPSGYQEVLVYNLKDLKGIDPKMQAVRIAHTVGKKKRAAILAEAKKKKITVLNLKVKETVEKEEEKTEEGEEKKVEEKPKSRKKKTKEEQKDNDRS